MSDPESPSLADGHAEMPPDADPFLRVVRCPSGDVDAFEAALALILDHRPEADVERVRARVDAWAAKLSRRIRHAGVLDDPLAGMLRCAQLLFEEEGLRGDVDSPLDPSNCDLELVLESRRGIPVTLALLQVEVARRAGLPAFIAGYPSRVLVGLATLPRPLFFDPFRGGRLVLPEWCQGLVEPGGQRARRLHADLAAPAPGSRVVLRLLTCWKNAWLRQGEVDGAIRAQDRLVDLHPDEDSPLTERARLALEAGRTEAAVRDLEAAARVCRDHAGLAAVRRQLEEVRRRLAETPA